MRILQGAIYPFLIRNGYLIRAGDLHAYRLRSIAAAIARAVCTHARCERYAAEA